MSARMRFGVVLAALGFVVCTKSPSQAGPIGLNEASTGRTGFNAARDFSLVTQATAYTSWARVSWPSSFNQPSLRVTAPPGPPAGSTQGNSSPPAPVPAATLSVTPTPPRPASAQVIPATAPAVITAAPLTAAPAPAPTQLTAAPTVDAFINLGTGPYPAAGTITTGNAQPWYNSPQVANLLGGPPNAQQQSDFAATVLQRVRQTFQQSGISVTITSDPNVAAAHTLSLVSNTNAQLLPSAIGMSYLGSDGFSFIDNQTRSAQTLDQLEWISAHNLSHELMLTFGVGENYDKSGNYIDSRDALWMMMTSPGAVFSPAAAQAINRALGQSPARDSSAYPQVIDPTPFPSLAPSPSGPSALLPQRAG